MSAFESAFALFGLLLGLSLAEVLGGFARMVEPRRTFQLGWLSPLLGMLVIFDVIAFWSSAWHLRGSFSFSAPTLLAATAFAGGYYLAAYMVFPKQATEAGDLDSHYFTVRRPVLGIIAAAGLIQFIHFGSALGWQAMAILSLPNYIFGILEALLILNMFTRDTKESLIVLATTVSLSLLLLFL